LKVVVARFNRDELGMLAVTS